MAPPLVVGVGGSVRPGSASDRALRVAMKAAERAGAETCCFGGGDLARLPLYVPGEPARSAAARELVERVREADGIVLASPGYHGAMSGVVKNALDYLEDLRDDERCYLDGRAVACVAAAAGWQACASTLAGLRATVHALRGWPTPLGVMINTAREALAADDGLEWGRAETQLELAAGQVVEFALMRRAALAARA